METTFCSETLVDFQLTTWHNKPEDRTLLDEYEVFSKEEWFLRKSNHGFVTLQTSIARNSTEQNTT